jgi:oligoendopeptidase F
MKGWADVEPYFSELAEREIGSLSELERWIADWSEVKSVVEEYATVRYVEMTRHTDDETKKNAYLECVRQVEPKLTEWENRLDIKYYESPYRTELHPALYAQFDKRKKADIELFSEKNIPLEVKLRELSQRYQEIMGAMTVNFQGRERTMPEMAQLLREPDRALREKAHKASAERRLVEKEKLDGLFGEMLKLRAEFAANLGLESYRDYCFRIKLRDYTPEDCLTFHEAIANTVVPLSRKLAKRRVKALGLDALRPWDADCDMKGRPPLQPFSGAEKLAQGVSEIFSRLDPRLGEMFESIRFSMDLDSRKGKAPGGYQTTYSERRVPFIFTNAVGSQNDVNTLLHEGGHAFHTLECRTQPLAWLRHAPMEFSEVASMAMELLGGRALDPFYENEEARHRARAEHMASIVNLFGWVAMVDAFQHWIYTTPGHTSAQRDAKWTELYMKFNQGTDWSAATPGALGSLWHRQLHIFEVPFYYVEYAIAQLGALQIYGNYRERERAMMEVGAATGGAGAHITGADMDSIDPKGVVDEYLYALSLGGTAPAHTLFHAAGIQFDFSEDLLGKLMEMVEEELDALG